MTIEIPTMERPFPGLSVDLAWPMPAASGHCAGVAPYASANGQTQKPRPHVSASPERRP